MKLSNLYFPVALCAAVTTTTLNAKGTPYQQLDLAYTTHWFGVDSAEPLDLSLIQLAEDRIGERAELRFRSDDGQTVNGIIAYPPDTKTTRKLALALHPMGIDQQFWWSEEMPLPAYELTSHLRRKGYAVVSLDARRHGKRGEEQLGPRELLTKAHSETPRLYIETIIGSVRDYRTLLDWAETELQPESVLVMGYSMGAQMSLLLASFEPSIDAVLAMVPPYVASPTSPVAPRIHAPRISNAKLLWLAGSDDPYSNQQQTQEAFDKVASPDKNLIWFDSGHRLPATFVNDARSFFDAIPERGKQ